MAITKTDVDVVGQNRAWVINVGADADTGNFVIAHGLTASAANDIEVTLTPLTNAANLAQWTVAWDATNITLTKNSNAAGSGGASQLRVNAQVPHSICE